MRSEGEIYFLRLILTTARGCTSFQKLLAHNGVVYDTFKDVAHAMGLLSDDNEVIFALEETVMFGSPVKLRQTFALMLKHAEISNPEKIWALFKDEFMSDLMYQERRRLGSNMETFNVKKVENLCLNAIEDLLLDMDISLTNVPGIPNPEVIQHVPKVIEREMFDPEQQRRLHLMMTKG